MSVKILHIADVHLDSPFVLFNIAEAEKRRNELRSAFSSAIMLAKDNNADLCFLAGDIFDSKYITRDGIEFVLSCIRRCPDTRFFLVPGNHDPASEDSVYVTYDFPKNLHVFTKPETIDIPSLNVTVSGKGFTQSLMAESPVAGWKIYDKSRINILVCHGDLTSPVSPKGPITEQEIEDSGFDYVALGHIHDPSGVCYAGKTAYCYAGCLVGRSYDEPGHHGVMLGTVEKGKIDLQFVKLSRKRYETDTCDLTDCDKYSAIEKIRSFVEKYKDDTYLRLIITGVLNEGFTLSPAEIGQGDGFPIKIDIIDKTVVKPKLSALENDVSLKGVFCRKMQDKSSLADGEDISDIQALAMKYGLSALEDRGLSNLMTESDDE